VKKIGAVMVVGGGIAGVQAALDLADSGFKVYVVEKTTAIGGVMSQLDKTFPTNDCAICIVSPKLVTAGRHINIQMVTNAEVKRLEGEAGNFKVTITKKSRYIDESKCVGCGVCARECPIEAIDTFNEGLSKSKAVSVQYPQAVPLIFSINRDKCLGCGVCSAVCKANAIRYDQTDQEVVLNVGAIIVALGFDEFDPTPMKQYGYGKFPNVVTSIEFERILSASGPFGGWVLRPSDGDIPEKLAFLQCIGSRDTVYGQEYCSSVCCMYTCKEAVIAKEHQHQVNPTIFSMDVRAFGKDFDKYIERAKKEYGIRYVRRRVAFIEENPETKNLILFYEGPDGKVIEEEFNMVVLSVGLCPSQKTTEVAEKLGIELNEYNFYQAKSFNPIETSKPGIYICGVCASPKDIPESIVEASAAAGRTQMLLSDSRNTLVTKKILPEELDISGQSPRIGVFVCHCGINIGGVVNVPSVVNYAETLPNVVYSCRNLYTCSADTQNIIKEAIKEHNLNRVIVASCSPRTHEPLFQETIREAGLNRYLFEMTNIRDQCSWVHMHEPEAATEKAKDLVRMAVAKANLIQPLERIHLKMIPRALVIGGGVAGMTAALGTSNQGFETYLLEQESELGGFSKNIHVTLEGERVPEFLKGLIKKVYDEKRIKVFTDSKIKSIDGYVGNFLTTAIHGEEKKIENLEHGIVIVATGAKEYSPKEYYYGKDSRVITQSELEQRLFSNPNIDKIQSVVMIQCVGSRNTEHPYCSRICCGEAIKNALKIKELNAKTEVTILYRDIRTYGLKEKYYREAREKGVQFIRFEESNPPESLQEGSKLRITVKTPEGEVFKQDTDILALSVGIVAPHDDNEKIAKLLKVPLNADGFFLEAHVKLRPVDFATEGVFLCGLAHSPKSIEESVSQALAAVSRASIYLSQESIEAEGAISFVRSAECVGCGICVRNCAYNAVELQQDPELGKVAVVNSALCKGCGLCAATCPKQAITSLHHTTEEILSQISILLEEVS